MSVPSTTSRRSFTLPARPAFRSTSTPASRNTSDGIETLFTCSASKIVSFTATNPAQRHSPTRTPRANGSPARSIPWTSLTERTLAVGLLRIYRVTASNVSFLNSGNLLHTIFPRSQCWCVDGQSVFVLRIRQDSYYRIELPCDTDEDRAQIAQLKSVLSQVLQYEKTQCPFTRGFQVEVPERPKTPPRRQLKKQPSQKVKRWTFDKTWVPQNGPRPSSSGFSGSDSGTLSSHDDDDRSSVCTDSSELLLDQAEITPRNAPSMPPPVARTFNTTSARRLSISERVSMFQGMRSAARPPAQDPRTAPAVTERHVSAMSMERIPELPRVDDRPSDVQKPPLERHLSEADSLASSTDSFYSVQTTSCASPSPRFLDAEPSLLNPWAESLPRQEETRGRSSHRRQVSEVTVRTRSANIVDQSAPVTPTISFYRTSMPKDDGSLSAPSTPPLVSDSDDDSVELPGLEVATPPDAIRMKRLTGASQRRAFSPMPNPQNLFVPPKPTLGRQFTSALVRKTCELVLGPPSHLVSLMLRIAQSISNFGFGAYRVRREEKIPCSWESEDEGEWHDEVDDFGIPLNGISLQNVGDPARQRRAFLGDLD
ncbi:inheritance of peroxisomes protein 1-domain-containing protein [Ampelomyces quisqualis]|uniref:Inheritance of peroxisomes protein 1 n=1 Tax=Ampelomyces quisqualis TaxID=50730 RepID=A0A6A5QKG3_AMPQU|nr:inheritance of peroxisomes protein 1-domain-containing protein [Ampelomyces quisqualis]